MRKFLLLHPLFVALLFALVLGVSGWADDDDDDDDRDRRGRAGRYHDDDDDERPRRKRRATLEFEDIRFFFEFNFTDEDLGVQLSLGAAPWKRLKILDPEGEEILEIEGDGNLEDFGLSSLCFESNEPTFDVVPRAEILALFPAGTYTFVGTTIDGDRLKGTAELNHLIPDAPVITGPEEGEVVDPNDVVVTWSAVTTPAGVEIESYEVIVTNDDNSRFVYDVRLGPSARSLSVPAEFFEPDTAYELEVLAVDKGGNQTISVVFFSTEE